MLAGLFAVHLVVSDYYLFGWLFKDNLFPTMAAVVACQRSQR